MTETPDSTTPFAPEPVPNQYSYPKSPQAGGARVTAAYGPTALPGLPPAGYPTAQGNSPSPGYGPAENYAPAAATLPASSYPPATDYASAESHPAVPDSQPGSNYPGAQGCPPVEGYPAAPAYAQFPGYPPAPSYPATPSMGYPAYGYQHPVSTQMPGSVRTAQVLSWIFAAIGIAMTIAFGAFIDARAAGAATGGFLFPFILAAIAFGFGSGRRGTRTAAMVVASISALMSLGSMAELGQPGPHPPGFLGVVVSIAIIVALAQRSSGAWFGRHTAVPRAYPPVPYPPGPPQY